MCGICCVISNRPQEPSSTQYDEKLRQLLSRRGPDGSFDKIIEIEDHIITLSSHILWTQGQKMQGQPMNDSEESKCFLFNGDIYSFPSCSQKEENDGLQLFNLLSQCVDDAEFLCAISKLQGPFAFILVEKYKKRLWFARDFFGRSSLVLSILSSEINNCSFFLSSVAPISELGNVCEIPSAGIFCLSLENYVLTIYPWNVQHCRVDMQDNTNKFQEFLTSKIINMEVNIQEDMKVDCVATKLKNIDSFNPNAILRDINEIISNPSLKNNEGLILLKVKDILEDYIQQFLVHLRKAVKLRVDLKPPFCKNCISKKIQDSNLENCDHTKIAILFSGGLDSTVLAALVAEILNTGDTLNLINVAFSSDEKQNFDKVPDRQTGIQSFHVLRQIFEPRGVCINFVEINITKSEVEKIRQENIVDLVSPLQSVLDDSIGCCFWFASRGKGIVKNCQGEEEESVTYSSPSRILFVGSGADELFGGYSRHRSAFEVRGWQGLQDEMQQDIDRISMRNLGRDNRVIMSHGVCPRMPFLDENVVHFVTQECPLWVKCCPLLPRGIGEKILLRATAAKLLGGENIHLALFHKRAIQFGSRLAKLENSKEKGGDICQRLKVQALT